MTDQMTEPVQPKQGVLNEFLRRINRHERFVITTLAIIIGVIGGYGAIFFRWVIHAMETVSFGANEKILMALGDLDWWRRFLPPVIGLTFVAPMVHWLAREAKGHGVPEVMESVTLKGGRIRPQVFLVKLFASAITIGTGGAVGREGPIVQIGSTAGSIIGQIFKASRRRMRILVGCGAAAGLAATFNAPIAGVLFALEILLGEYATMTLSPIVISSVIATVVSRAHLGNTPAFVIPPELMKFHWSSFWEIGTFLILGIACGILGLIFSRLIYASEDFFDAIKLPVWFKAFLGAILVGLIVVFIPNVAGVGYDTIEALMSVNVQEAVHPAFITSHMDAIWMIVLTLFIGKMIATALTLGLGGSGGVFAPTLFIGASAGFLIGLTFNILMPGMVSSPGAYALVAMGAMVAGATHAPMTSIIILFEMTGDYMIILPVMLACIASTLIAQKLDKDSIYTKKLSRRGVKLNQGREEGVLEGIEVSKIMRKNFDVLSVSDKFDSIVQKVNSSRQLYFPVVDLHNKMVGILGYDDLRNYLHDSSLSRVVIAHDVARKNVKVLLNNESLLTAFKKFNTQDLEQLPVVDAKVQDKVLGMLSRRDLINAYNKAVIQKDSELQELESH